MVRESINIFLKILIVLLLVWFCLTWNITSQKLDMTITQATNSDWCSPEIELLRNQVSDLWYEAKQ